MGRAAPIVPFQVELDLPGAQGLAADLRGVTARHVLKHLEEEELTPDRRQPTRQLLFGSVFFLVPEGLSQ